LRATISPYFWKYAIYAKWYALLYTNVGIALHKRNAIQDFTHTRLATIVKESATVWTSFLHNVGQALTIQNQVQRTEVFRANGFQWIGAIAYVTTIPTGSST